jgi:LPS-assembly protein
MSRTGPEPGRPAVPSLTHPTPRLGQAMCDAAWPPRGVRQALAASGLAAAIVVAIAPQVRAQPNIQPDMLGASPMDSLRDRTPAPAAPAGSAPAPASGNALQSLGRSTAAPVDRNAPVTFTADEVEYDRETGVVTARGHVEAWQGERVLRADEFTYNRNTGVATARGNVQLLEPDGQVMFADEAELKDEFKNGVLREVRALLAANVRIAANGARRTDGTINELSRVVYSSCNLCVNNPLAPPQWQVQARVATQDKNLQRITYRDAMLQVHGVPVFYTPYLSHPDPSAPRASGFLFPQLGQTRYLNAFAMIPYYWVINGNSDLTITPLFSTRQYPFLLGEYRNRLNYGEISGSFSLGGLGSANTPEKRELAGHIFVKGSFTLDEHWRAGFDINRATSDKYLQTIRTYSRPVYASTIYAEGFWDTEQYARIDARGYQSTLINYNNSQLPYVLPNVFYERAPKETVGGGYLTMDAGLLSIFREVGSHTQRVATQMRWTRQDFDSLGGLWTFRLQGNANGYWAGGQDQAPINLPAANGWHDVGNIRAAADWRMPFVRYTEDWGHQVIEPRVQVVTGPRMGRQTWLPNEDSIDFEFTDANLFSLNRFTGRDRMEGDSRVDAALRGAWTFPNGGQVEGIVGRSYTLIDDHSVSTVYPNNGLERPWSDWVARLRLSPVPWFETIGRVRLDSTRPTERRMVDSVALLHLGPVTLSAGYFYSLPLPYLLETATSPGTREEVSLGGSARIGGNWRVNASVKYDLKLGRFALIQGGAGYEDECLIIEGRFVKRFNQDLTTFQDYPINTVVLVHIGLKTLGDYFFRAL